MQKIKLKNCVGFFFLLCFFTIKTNAGEVERKVKFNTLCSFDDSFVSFDGFLKYRDPRLGNLEMYLSLSCAKSSKNCHGVEISTAHGRIGETSLNPLIFEANSILDKSEYLAINSKNRRYVFNKKTKEFELTRDYPSRNPPVVEIWKGSCE